MRKFLVLLAPFALAGCVHAQMVERCASYGHFQGNPDFEPCMRQERAIQFARDQQLTNALMGAAAIYSMTAPQPVYYASSPSVNCSQMGYFWHCQ